MSDVKRRYLSALRSTQAEATRGRIVEAARKLFLEEGYAAVAIQRVAKAAGVAVQTVYAVFGSKRGLLLALGVSLNVTADLPQFERDLERAGTDSHAALEAAAAFQRRLYERNYAYLEVIRGAALADETLAGPWKAGQARHRREIGRFIQRLSSLGALRPDLSLDEATHVAAAIADISLYTLLVGQAAWSPSRYETWLADALQRLLVR